MASSREHVIPGAIYGGVPRLPKLPPFVPLPDTSSSSSSSEAAAEKRGLAPAATTTATTMDWDTTLVGYGINWPQIENDRRHSGWEEVEKRWTRQQGAAAEQQQASSQQPGGAHKERRSDSGGKKAKASSLFPYPHLAIPVPGLESDFRMRVQLSSQSASVAVGDGFKKWTTVAKGEWSGRLGCGVVVSGGQDSQDLVYGKTMATQVEATHRLMTSDEIPAYIECKSRGFRTGPPELMRALQDPEKTESVDSRLIQYRVALTMKTTDERYAEEVNFGLWVGSCLWRGSEVIYDVYKIT